MIRGNGTESDPIDLDDLETPENRLSFIIVKPEDYEKVTSFLGSDFTLVDSSPSVIKPGMLTVRYTRPVGGKFTTFTNALREAGIDFS